MLPLKQRYRDLLETTEKEYKDDKTSIKYIDAASSLQIVLGDLCYYDDELEEAGMYYKNAVELIGKDKDNPERLYLYVRNKLKIGMIHEKRKQYDFAYQTYSELCEQIIVGRNNTRDASLPWYFKFISPGTYRMLSQKMTYEGLKMLYLPFIAKLQILEKSHVGGITRNHLELLDNEFNFLTSDINHKEAKLLEAEFYSRVADILYYKNTDLNYMNHKKYNISTENTKNCSCTACDYYHNALSILLNSDKTINKDTVTELLGKSVEQINNNYNMKYCTILARILSDWGNVFFSCDTKGKKSNSGCYISDIINCITSPNCRHRACYICDNDACNADNLLDVLKKYINSVNSTSKEDADKTLLTYFAKSENIYTKLEIAFAMYAVSSKAYRKANQFKRSAYQMYKMLSLFKH
jgi:hypothetical protein